MNYIDHIKTCLENTHKQESKLTPLCKSIPGMCALPIRILYNNICSFKDCHYLEIGSFRGSSVCASLCNNDIKTCVCIDNFSQFNDKPHKYGNPRYDIRENVKHFIGNTTFQLFDEDCWKFDNSKIGTFNVYLYDGPHEYDDHYKALPSFIDNMEPIFIYIVDDWNWTDVRKGTFDSFDILPIRILYKHEIRTNEPFRQNGNGTAIFVIEKIKTSP